MAQTAPRGREEIEARSKSRAVRRVAAWLAGSGAPASRGSAPLRSSRKTIKWGNLVYFANGPVVVIRAEPRRVLFGLWRGQRLGTIEPRPKPGGKMRWRRWMKPRPSCPQRSASLSARRYRSTGRSATRRGRRAARIPPFFITTPGPTKEVPKDQAGLRGDRGRRRDCSHRCRTFGGATADAGTGHREVPRGHPFPARTSWRRASP